ncbi:MAG: ATPase [Candidatus Azobacteroides sp.]|nr:ATPase [Candidatus Azobacteroides sp.]
MENIKLIADSGSTQCDWIVSENDDIIYQTDGINPFYQTADEIFKIISELLSNNNLQHITSVHFYGAGCSFPEKKETVKEALSRCLPEADIEIESDLLAAARGLCGKEPGIACILGTGSNSCFYNGTVIKENIPPLGYILGDEGSGAVIGRIFIGNLLKKQYPDYLYKNFMDYYGTSPQEIMDCVYKKPFPNRYLGQFTKFIAENIKDSCLYDLVFDAFVSFINRNIIHYDYLSYPTYFTGSIAFHFEDILRDACLTHGIWPAGITQSPLMGLMEYHR